MSSLVNTYNPLAITPSNFRFFYIFPSCLILIYKKKSINHITNFLRVSFFWVNIICYPVIANLLVNSYKEEGSRKGEDDGKSYKITNNLWLYWVGYFIKFPTLSLALLWNNEIFKKKRITRSMKISSYEQMRCQPKENIFI